jgi:DNA polymerase III subunit gamma/tau
MAQRPLALKYRPQVFSDLVGQEHVSQVLTRAIEGGRVAHAYLFAGARGVGKTTSARILAKALNCERRGTMGTGGAFSAAEPCNECPSCLEITSGVSLDVAEIDGASNRGIADVQALREKVRFAPTGGRHRVVIIDEVHQLSSDAFAALLKTLEEPPAHLVFIFATTDPQKLPETIRSRTQRFDFARVPLRKVAARLEEIAQREAKDPEGMKFRLTEGASLLIAQKSEGSIRDAVSALDQVVSSGEATIDEELVRRVLGIADREAFFTLVGAIVRHDPKSALTTLHEAFAKGLDPSELAQGLNEHVRHLLILKVDPEAADLVPVAGEDLARLREQAQAWSEHDLMRLLTLASDLAQPMRDTAQPMIHLEAAVLQMATLEPGETLAELLARLEALEKKLEGGGAPSKADLPPGRTSSSGEKPLGPSGARSAPLPALPRSIQARSAIPGSASPRTTPPAPSTFSHSRPIEGSVGNRATVAAVSPSPVVSVSPSASATAVLDEEPVLDGEVQERWDAAIQAVNAKKRMLGAFLQESRFVGVTGRGAVLAADDLHRSVVDERENRALLESHLAEIFGRPLALHCVPLDADGSPPPQARDVRPLVERARQWFDGDPIGRPDGSAQRSDR